MAAEQELEPFARSVIHPPLPKTHQAEIDDLADAIFAQARSKRLANEIRDHIARGVG